MGKVTLVDLVQLKAFFFYNVVPTRFFGLPTRQQISLGNPTEINE